MTAQQRDHALYIALVRRIDHASRRRVAFADEHVPSLITVVGVAILGVIYGIAVEELPRILLAAVPALVLFGVNIALARERHLDDLRHTALELRLRLGPATPAGTNDSKTAKALEAQRATLLNDMTLLNDIEPARAEPAQAERDAPKPEPATTDEPGPIEATSPTPQGEREPSLSRESQFSAPSPLPPGG